MTNKHKLNWDKKCQCGCGLTTKYKNNYIIGHHNRGKKQSQEHKNRRVKSWYAKGNAEKMSKRVSGENNPGKSEKNRKRMREHNPMKNKESYEKHGRNNPMKKQENIDKIKITKNERYGSANYNNKTKYIETMLERYGFDNPAKVKHLVEKRTKTHADNLANGIIQSKNNWKYGWYENGNKKEWYDSSFELRKMKEYDSKLLCWTKKHGIKIPYINDAGFNTYYVPDFLITLGRDKLIVEIKGWLIDSAVLKAKMAIEWCKKNNYQYYFLLGENLILQEYLSYFTTDYLEFI